MPLTPQHAAWLKENFGPSGDLEELEGMLNFLLLQHQGPLLGRAEEKEGKPTTVRLTAEDHRKVSQIVDQKMDPRFNTKSDFYTHWISLGISVTLKLFDFGTMEKSYKGYIAKAGAVEWARSVKREIDDLERFQTVFDEARNNRQSLVNLRSALVVFRDNVDTDMAREKANDLIERVEGRIN